MKNQRIRNFAIVAVTAMLLAAAAASITALDNVYAYKKNQATSQANDCANGEVPTNVGCQNIGSQIQGDENAVALTAQQTFPAEEQVTPVPPTEDKCREVEGTLWDITLIDPLDSVPPGTVLCLPLGLDVIQDATLVPQVGPATRDVTVTAIPAGTSACPAGFTVKAEATSGTPPAPVVLGDTVCVKEGGPP